MASDNETLKDIVAELRGNEFDDPHLNADGIIGARILAKGWADRIEAAWKREKTTIEADALAVGGLVEASHKRELFTKTRKNDNSGAAIYTNDNSGNAAALREALEQMLRLANIMDYDAGRDWHDDLQKEMLQVAHDALAKPPRNCDVGTPNEQGERCLAQFNQWRREGDGRKLIAAIMEWAQMPYNEEGGAK